MASVSDTRMLGRIIGRAAALAPRRHQDLMSAMLAELDSIENSAERLRFAFGAIAAIAHLSVFARNRRSTPAPGPVVGPVTGLGHTHSGGPAMSLPTSSQLLRRLAPPFAISLLAMTGLLVANYVTGQSASLSDGVGTTQLVVLNLPHVLALTIPMAVFVAVSWSFARLGRSGVLESAAGRRGGVLRLMTPVVGTAAVIAGVTLVLTTQVLPRTNLELQQVLAAGPVEASDRTMTVGELNAAAQAAQAEARPDSEMRAARYRIEIHKKFAIAAACIFFALIGAAIPMRFPRGGLGLAFASTGVVFVGYYVMTMMGESLADELVLSPFLAMWAANAVLTALVLLLFGTRRTGVEEVAID